MHEYTVKHVCLMLVLWLVLCLSYACLMLVLGPPSPDVLPTVSPPTARWAARRAARWAARWGARWVSSEGEQSLPTFA